jgi:hypothetical protein
MYTPDAFLQQFLTEKTRARTAIQQDDGPIRCA